MELPINTSPDLTMAEITRKLFNSKFLSDIQFRIAGQTLYAHSLELMKRSTVFQHQLGATLGDSKLIPIDEISYSCFYQFIQFIYTDKCELNCNIIFDIFKLSIKYKVPKLQNMAMEYLNNDTKYTLRLFDMCITEKIQLPLGRVIENIAHDLSQYLSTPEFLSIQSKSLEQILSFKRINAKESHLFRSVMQWMDHKIDNYLITIEEGRALLDNFIKLIRFSSMSVDDFLDGLSRKYKWFSDNDVVLILVQIEKLTGCRLNELHCSSCKCRFDYSYPYDWLNVPSELIEPTTFTVTKDLLFIGVRYGNDGPETNHVIQLSGLEVRTNIKTSLEFIFPAAQTDKGTRIFSFGSSLQLKPNIQYSLNISYLDKQVTSYLLCRKPDREAIIRAPRDTIRLSKVGLNIIELHFNSVAGEDETLIIF